MRPMIVFADARSVAWANGLGRTTELISWADGQTLSGPPEWRLSIAELTAPAPFSPLPGVRRHFLPVGGSVTLTVNGAVRRVSAGTVAEFAGDDVVELVELVDGPCHAVNLMVRTDPDRGGPNDPGPVLTVGHSDRAAGSLLVVALAPAAGFDRFDVLEPAVAMAVSVPAALIQ